MRWWCCVVHYALDPHFAGGETLLSVAAASGDVEVARLLLKEGAKAPLPDQGALAVNAVSALNRTALHEAAAEGHAKVLRLLLDHGAASYARDTSGHTALALALRHKHLHCAQVLMMCGALPEECTPEPDLMTWLLTLRQRVVNCRRVVVALLHCSRPHLGELAFFPRSFLRLYLMSVWVTRGCAAWSGEVNSTNC